MSAESAFRSSAPEVLAAWEDTQRRHREWHEAVGAFEAEYPNHRALTVGRQHRRELFGLRGEGSPGKEWRYNRGHDAWVADKRSKAGKALAARIDATKATGLGVMPGMPDMTITGGRWLTPAVFFHDGAVFVFWRCPVEAITGWSKQELDPVTWEQVPLSTYHLAREANEAAKEAA